MSFRASIVCGAAAAVAILLSNAALAQTQIVGERWVAMQPNEEAEDQLYSCSIGQIAAMVPFTVHVLLTSGEVVVSVPLFYNQNAYEPEQITSLTIGFDSDDPTAFAAGYEDPSHSIDARVPAAFLDRLAGASTMAIAIAGLGVTVFDLRGSSSAVEALRGCASASASAAVGELAWQSLRQTTGALRSLVKLEEQESVDDTFVAEVRLKQSTPAGSSDAIMVHRRSSFWCGSSGCRLEIYMLDDASTAPVMQLNVDVVSLGRDYTNGYRNLRFEDAVTWVWDGSKYTIK